jgi:hypothetical protein
MSSLHGYTSCMSSLLAPEPSARTPYHLTHMHARARTCKIRVHYASATLLLRQGDPDVLRYAVP